MLLGHVNVFIKKKKKKSFYLKKIVIKLMFPFYTIMSLLFVRLYKIYWDSLLSIRF